MAIEGATSCPELDECVQTALTAAKDLSKELSQAALQQTQELSASIKQSQELASAIRQHALIPQPDRLHQTSSSLYDCIDHILEVSTYPMPKYLFNRLLHLLFKKEKNEHRLWSK